jgi:hypothetical protein
MRKGQASSSSICSNDLPLVSTINFCTKSTAAAHTAAKAKYTVDTPNLVTAGRKSWPMAKLQTQCVPMAADTACPACRPEKKSSTMAARVTFGPKCVSGRAARLAEQLGRAFMRLVRGSTSDGGGVDLRHQQPRDRPHAKREAQNVRQRSRQGYRATQPLAGTAHSPNTRRSSSQPHRAPAAEALRDSSPGSTVLPHPHSTSRQLKNGTADAAMVPKPLHPTHTH